MRCNQEVAYGNLRQHKLAECAYRPIPCIFCPGPIACNCQRTLADLEDSFDCITQGHDGVWSFQGDGGDDDCFDYVQFHMAEDGAPVYYKKDGYIPFSFKKDDVYLVDGDSAAEAAKLIRYEWDTLIFVVVLKKQNDEFLRMHVYVLGSESGKRLSCTLKCSDATSEVETTLYNLQPMQEAKFRLEVDDDSTYVRIDQRYENTGMHVKIEQIKPKCEQSKGD